MKRVSHGRSETHIISRGGEGAPILSVVKSIGLRKGFRGFGFLSIDELHILETIFCFHLQVRRK
jgi:hypothetical protein